MTDEDITLVGMDPVYSRPEWMILTVLSLPEMGMRPVVTYSSGGKTQSEDPLTRQLQAIVKVGGTCACALASACSISPFHPASCAARLLEQPGYLRKGLRKNSLRTRGYQLSSWGLWGKRGVSGAIVVSKLAARGELTARLFLRFYPPGEPRGG
jgi:hypothetical protein